MQNIPKSVVKHLQSQTPGSHPDAELLTALAERSLAGSERDHVMEHLARCGDCREVVALALPALEEVVVVKPAKAAHWFSWPVFRWSFVTAGILAIASIGYVQLRHGREKTIVATSLQPSEPLREAEKAHPALPAAAESAVAESPTQTVEQKKDTSSNAETSGDKSIATTKAVAQQPRPMQRSFAGNAGGPIHGLMGGAVHGAVGAGRFMAAPAGSRNNSAPLTADDSVTVGKAKPAAPQASAVMPSPLLHTDPTLMQGSPRWTISDSGALQRSLDGGRSWQDVTIAADQSTVAGQVRPVQAGENGATQTTVEVSAATPVVQSDADAQSRAEASQVQTQTYNGPSRMKSALKVAANPAVVSKKAPASSTGMVFRALAVSSNNAEVWVGGSDAVLYHTMDAGNHWVRVLPADSGTVLAGDILSIQFVDAMHGTLRTSSGESWITSDDGQTWHKQ